MKKNFILIMLLCLGQSAISQPHPQSKEYSSPENKLVQEKLEDWKKKKFGLLMHWGPYSQWGIEASWSLCPEDDEYTARKGPFSKSYSGYVKAYEDLQTQFNPVNFNPEKWSAAAKDAGMKYVVFTTKHHDGFAMFDTKETDYKITSAKSPFSSNPRSNITKEVFSAFRNDGFMIGAYFSKPDWHSEHFWWPYLPARNRDVNYKIAQHPEKWNAFKKFTYNQIEELMTDYGKVDILWFDGGWVRPEPTGKNNQDLNMSAIAAMARKKQPGILIVDRTVPGEFENYQTPEQTVPDKPLDQPWESCITMGNSWGYVKDDTYKPAHELIHTLIKIVSRNGNFLLNIGPSPLGELPPEALSRLKEIGSWMNVYGTAIYESTALAPYESKGIVYTQSADKKVKYVFLLSDGDNRVMLSKTLSLATGVISKNSKISIMGSTIKLKHNAETNQITIPESAQKNVFNKYAVVLKIVG
ncbi:alpha-L-fucosidase [Pedobacter nyackensis]|uniref:alpha-L-fucosidase n=1 Tax=Pedobacter nyackensis TaxID=475255 RepID=UPI00292E8BDD|nr:alpha-L-fucosidase [Pedobacter nyackensis]